MIGVEFFDIQFTEDSRWFLDRRGEDRDEEFFGFRSAKFAVRKSLGRGWIGSRRCVQLVTTLQKGV